MTSHKVAFFDIGGTLGNVRLTQNNEFGSETNAFVEPVHEREWFKDLIKPGQSSFAPTSSTVKLNLFPGIEEVLRDLHSKHVRLGIISKVGDFPFQDVTQMLKNANIYQHFEEELFHYIKGESPKDVVRFQEAIKTAGLKKSNRIVYVGEDEREREQAKQAGMVTAARPSDVLSILDDIHLYYLKFTISAENQNKEWHHILLQHQTRLLGEFIDNNNEINAFAIADSRSINLLRNEFPALQIIGKVDHPYVTDLYLLRDRDILGYPKSFNKSWIVDKITEANKECDIVALPFGQTLDEIVQSLNTDHGHSPHSFLHGHDIKLTPSAAWSLPIGFGPNSFTPDWLPSKGSFNHFNTTENLLTAEEVEVFSQEVTESLIRNHIENYSQSITRSRHSQHVGNRIAAKHLVTDLEMILGEGFVKTDRFVHEGRILENIIAWIPGQSNEITIVSAHMDSTGANNPSTEDAPGADDDASGIAAVLAAAEAIKKMVDKTKRQPVSEIQFVLFNAEEQGLVGSREYIGKLAACHARISAGFQMDMIGYDRIPPSNFEVHFGYATRPEVQERSRDLALLISRIAGQLSTNMTTMIYPSSPSEPDPADGRSDHSSLHMAGYPACVVSENFFPFGTADGNPHYHTPADTIGELNMTYATNIARIVAAATWVNANFKSSVVSDMKEASFATQFLEIHPSIRDIVNNSKEFSSWKEQFTTMDIDGVKYYLGDDGRPINSESKSTKEQTAKKRNPGADQLQEEDELILQWARDRGIVSDEEINKNRV